MSKTKLTEQKLEELVTQIVKILSGLENEEAQKVLRLSSNQCKNHAIVTA